MSVAVRVILTALIIAAAAFAFQTSVAAPYRCNVLTAEIEQRTKSILVASEMRSAPAARANVASMRQCIRVCPTDVNPYMLAAANLELLGRVDEAAEMYQAALPYHRRPELYLNLGIAQLQLGDRANAVDNLVRARVFNQWVDAEVPPIVREEVRRRSSEVLPDRR